jgi:ribosome-associated heat shock protein Hsp15
VLQKDDRLDRQRLDKWLWHARVVKARTSAAPGHAIKTGDVLTIGLDHSVRVLKVIGFAERRGDAASARVLYDDLQGRRE